MSCCIYAQRTYAQQPAQIPLLTVCEALGHLNTHRGKDVVIVARSVWTFEGSFLNEQCEADGRILIHGERWLSMIEVRAAGKIAEEASVFPVDETLLSKKLLQIDGNADLAAHNLKPDVSGSTPHVLDLSSYWVAVYGRIESPIRLRQDRRLRASNTNYRGNGYASNGTVPARILVISDRTLGRVQ